jgi:hypothetical protein
MASTPHRLPPIGIQDFSSHIALDPTLSIYRRFATLNARNLLYLQSELASLEARLVLLDQRADDVTKGNDIWAMPRSWRAIKGYSSLGFVRVCCDFQLSCLGTPPPPPPYYI